MSTRFDLSDLGQRQKAWQHAWNVLVIPEFVALAILIQDCGLVDRMIIDLENRQERKPDGSIVFKDHAEVAALAHLWVLAFFSIFQTVCGKDYERVAEIKISSELRKLKKRIFLVRTAFAHLQKPNTSSYILPSYSSLVGPCGIVYAVYDEQGKEIDIPRRELADNFLRMMEPLPPSARFRSWIGSATRTDPPDFDNAC
jgi:hypothetical protein